MSPLDTGERKNIPGGCLLTKLARYFVFEDFSLTGKEELTNVAFGNLVRYADPYHKLGSSRNLDI